MEKLQKISWRYSFKGNENGCLTDPVYAPPKGLWLFQRFLTVICGFRAVAHYIYNREAAWLLVRNDLLLRLESNPEGCLQNVAVMVGDKASPQSPRESINLVKGSAELSKWFSSDMHGQITADTYDLFVAMINPSSGQVLVWAPRSFQSAEETRAALHTAKLLGMLFSGSGD